jgi:outer membrane autotransporter protein
MNTIAAQSPAQWSADLAQLSPTAVTPLFQMGFASARAQAQAVGDRVDALMAEADEPGITWSKNGASPMFASTLSPRSEMARRPASAPMERLSGFITGVGDFATITGTGGVEGYTFTTSGVQAGVDYWFDPDVFVAGLLAGYNQDNSTATDGGTVQSTGGSLGLYTGFRMDDWRVTALVDGGMNSYKIQNPSLGGTASVAPQGERFGGELTLGLDLNATGLLITPFASGEYEYVRVESFQQTGAGLLAPESFPSQGEGNLASQLGVKAGQALRLGGDAKLTPSFLVSWDHVYQGNQDQLTAGFGVPGSSFTVNGPSMGTDAAVLGFGLEAQFSREITFLVQYQGRIGMTNNQSQQLTGGVEVGF